HDSRGFTGGLVFNDHFLPGWVWFSISKTAVTGIDESGGEARMYAIDENLIFKTQRPNRLRPRTSQKREVFFLQQLEGVQDVSVPRVVGYGQEDGIEYTLMTRMPGAAFKAVNPTGEARRQTLFELGHTLRRIHGLPQPPFVQSRLFPGDHAPVDVTWRFGNLFDDALAAIAQSPQPWPLDIPPVDIARRAMWALPDVDECVALHSNPGPEHVFVDPQTGQFVGLIDFGDAYISHPVLDLRRWPASADRDALWDGYTADTPASDDLLRTWQVAQILIYLSVITRNSEQRATAAAELLKLQKALN
ncbi:MAG: aminoglycoside phosphotransferase family protein, partial [Anaerolineae bacterium]|nr:aminoglycoside phosphotransferase family protein [Anaerolineae bacterium]